MTTHDAASWNVNRATMRDHSHEVDGIRYIGGRGARLDDLVQNTYVEEARQLGADLAECLEALPPALATGTLDGMKGALTAAAEHRQPPRYMADDPDDANIAVVEVDQVMFDGPIVVDAPPDPEPAKPRRRGRNGGGDDAAAALDLHRADDTGQVDATLT